MKFSLFLLLFCLLACEREFIKDKVIADVPVSLEGLERIYFEQLDDREAAARLPAKVSANLPLEIKFAGLFADSTDRGGDDLTTRVRDFHMPAEEADLWLREVTASEHPRISQIGWAIYYLGKRTDLWYYSADPRRTDQKLLPNYQVDSVYALSEDRVILRLRGSLYRPGGFWQVKGIDLNFSLKGGRLRLVRVRNAFTLIHAYNAGDTLDIMTEREIDGHFVHREAQSVTMDQLNKCGLGYLLDAEPWVFSWADLERGCACLTAGAAAIKTVRSFAEPSFIERGGTQHTGGRMTRHTQPGQPGVAYFTSPEAAIPMITQMLVQADFHTLARYYDLSGSQVQRAQLESGAFFIRQERPELAHPAGYWRYKHPFAPGFKFSGFQATAQKDIYRVEVTIAIEQGADAPMQTGVSSFLMIRSDNGWQIRPEQSSGGRGKIKD